jgi:pimeloyl-ACP methyl ester carboxylesterase
LKIPTPNGDLGGTIALPADQSNMPAVLIVAGSGPTDRDGNGSQYGLESNLYKLLAEGLAESGIASLRYDKRGVGASTSPEALQVPLVLDTYVQDVVLALEATEKINGVTAVFLLGHSQGGLLSILAAHEHAPRGLVLLESQGRSMADLISAQLHAAPVPDDLKTRADEIMDELQHGRSVADVPTGLTALFAPRLQPFMKSILSVDPGREIESLQLPTLIIQGTADLQTSMQDAQHLREGDPDAKLLELPGANHVLRDVDADREANLATYRNPDLPLDPKLLPALVSFIRLHAP